MQTREGFMLPDSRKDVWLVPKRSNIYQIIGIVETLADPAFDNKVWNNGKQEAVATKLRLRNLTDGRNFSGQSVRTLFANGPKYLGLVYTDSDKNDSSSRGGKIYVTPAGHKLVNEDLLAGDQVFNNLAAWQRGYTIPESTLLQLQLMKLILNNPITSNGGKFLVHPFLNTLKLCERLGYLDAEELGYIVFSMTSEDQLDLIERRILNFRSLDDEQRKLEIEAYMRTEAGKLTLVKAPSVNYFMNFCQWSGIFSKYKISTYDGKRINAIKIINEDYQTKLEGMLPESAYDFRDNVDLWIDYYGDPNRLNPPRDVNLNIDIDKAGMYYLEVIHNETVVSYITLEGVRSTSLITVYDGDEYLVKINTIEGTSASSQSFVVAPGEDEINLHLTAPAGTIPALEFGLDTIQGVYNTVSEISTGNGYDTSFYNLLVMRKRLQGKDDINNRTKGGRLEYIFFKLLSILYEEGKIDYLKWYGKLSDSGIPGPAPGGSNGNPDLVFEIDDISVVIELTTIRGNAGQWSSSEAASVPDHIKNYAKNQSNLNRTIGIFSAPTINDRVESNFDAQTHIHGTPIKCLSLQAFVELLSKSRTEIKDSIESMME